MPGNPCSACVSQGAYSALLMEPGASTHTFDSSSERYPFLGENIVKHRRVLNPNAITGYLEHWNERLADGGTFIFGNVYLLVTPGDMDNLLPRMIGPLDTGVYYPTNCFQYFGIMIQRDYGVFVYHDCIVAKWRLWGEEIKFRETAQPDLMVLELTIIAESETGPHSGGSAPTWPDPEPSYLTTAAYDPYVFQESSVSLVSATRPVHWLELSCDHMPDVQYMNSTTPTSTCSQGRQARLRARLQWNSTNLALYNQALTGTTASVTFTKDNMSTVFTFDRLIDPGRTPVVQNKQSRIPLIIDGWAATDTLGDTDHKDIRATNDSTP